MNGAKGSVLGFKADLCSFSAAADFVLNKINKSEGLHIVTINPEIIASAEKDEILKGIIKRSELVLPESIGITGAMLLKGIRQEKIPGIDFAKELIKRCEAEGYPIALLGAKEEVLIKAQENLKKEFPDLKTAYAHNGYYEDENSVIDGIKNSGAKLILCALGAPKQEFFIDKCRKSYNSAVYIGIGGSFDVWAGAVQRAPLVFQKTGLEWLYRTIKEPFRIKRIYKTLPVFLFRAVIESIFAGSRKE